MPKGCHHGAEIDAEISAGTMRTAAASVSELLIIVLMIEQKVVPKLVLKRNRKIKKTQVSEVTSILSSKSKVSPGECASRKSN